MVTNVTQTRIGRAHVFKYSKSGNLVAIARGNFVLEMSSYLSKIDLVRSYKRLNWKLLLSTKYTVEFSETITPSEEQKNWHSFHLIRVLAAEDLDPRKWRSTLSLESLPVSPVSPGQIYWDEELIWAGKLAGNMGGGVLASTLPFCLVAVPIGLGQDGYIWLAIAAAISVIIAARYPWKRSKPPNPEKLRELDAHKRKLRQRLEGEQTLAKTHFEQMLEDYRCWRTLSPDGFEVALSLRLEKEGYQVQKNSIL